MEASSSAANRLWEWLWHGILPCQDSKEPDLQVSSWAQRGLLASQVLKASKEVRKTTPKKPTRLQMLPSNELHFIVEK